MPTMVAARNDDGQMSAAGLTNQSVRAEQRSPPRDEPRGAGVKLAGVRKRGPFWRSEGAPCAKLILVPQGQEANEDRQGEDHEKRKPEVHFSLSEVLSSKVRLSLPW
jgi:hypothetical protein